MPSSGSLLSLWTALAGAGAQLSRLQRRCVASEPVPSQGVSGPARAGLLPLPALGWARVLCRSAYGRVAGLPLRRGAPARWLWESLDSTSDLGKALTRRKDTASSCVSSYCHLCSPCPPASGRRRRGGRWPGGRGRLGGHLAMVSTVNTILHKSSLK